MILDPSRRLQTELALAKAARARARCCLSWRPNWGRIAAVGFCLAFWILIAWALTALFRAWS